nr:hypothetical protein GCM10020092_031460 [Actinoplanes digitatis]
MALFAVSFVVFELLANRHHGKIKEQVLLRMGWPNAIFVATEVAAKQLRSMSSTPVAGGPPSAAAAPNSRPHLAASTDDIRGRKPHD